MDRPQVIAEILSTLALSAPRYLEIGVQAGFTFHAVDAAFKVAVDPSFAFDVAEASADPRNAHCSYYPVTSDRYFSEHLHPLQKFDLIFIDGHHTFDQTLKDLVNSLACLAEGGVIIVDDVMPISYFSSISDIVKFTEVRKTEGFADGSWMGDVYKLVFFVKEYMTLFDYATVEENHGQMIMWRAARPCDGQNVAKVETISRLEYSDFLLNKTVFNLLPLRDILRKFNSSRSAVGKQLGASGT